MTRPSVFALVLVLLAACTTAGTPAPAAPGASSTAPGAASASSAPAGGGGGGDSAAACNYLSVSDIQSLTGAASASFTGTIGSTATGDAGCGWHVPDGGVATRLYTGAGAADATDIWAGVQSAPAVSGLGDEAHWDASADHLVVKVGAAFVYINVNGNGVKDHEAAAIGLAKLIVPKLGH